MSYPKTPDGRYFVIRGQLWRCTNPALDPDLKTQLVKRLMDARRGVKDAKRQGDNDALLAAREEVNKSKIALGERGPVWWTSSDPDYNRFMAKNTPYADWFTTLIDG